ncbi:MAG: hypothetical protein R6W76_14820, partial [Caldilinea sp.]
AVWLAALNPFQIYYSQEARMYMLLAVETAGLFLALLWMVDGGDWEIGRLGESGESEPHNRQSPISESRHRLLPQLLFLFFGIAGLWTHYSFPIVLAAAGFTFVIWWVVKLRPFSSKPQKLDNPARPLLQFIGLNLLMLLAYLPWLPTAIDRVLNWPRRGVDVGLWEGLALTLRTLLFGPLRTVPDPLWPWLALAGILPLIGLFAWRRLPVLALMAGLWLLLPIAMMFGLGLFTDAFLKFLLVASPAWCLLVAATPWVWMQTGSAKTAARTISVLLFAGVAAFGIGAAAATLPAYYADPFARDNYQGVARYLTAVGDARSDLVILNAPGQQEVWRYYDSGLPVLALPAQRPPVAADVEAQLGEAMAGKRRVYALFWATDEADPQQIVERWLDANAFKTVESWQGNLRFVAYALASDLEPTAIAPVRWENGMILEGVEQPELAPQRVAPGDAALVRLWWSATAPITQRYKVSVQLLDNRNQVIAQHDGEPAGSAAPTDRWQPGDRIADNHGLAIPFGASPGLYRLVAVLYDAETGERVLQDGQDAFAIGEIVVERANRQAPLDVIPMQYRLDASLGPVRLVGYDAHRRGSAHAPETPIQPGELVNFTFYWQTPDPLPANWRQDLTMTVRLGGEQISAPLGGGAYPTGDWSGGEVVRSAFDMVYDGGDNRPVLTVEGASVTLHSLPTRR